ncbi:MAG: DUF1499 domain-containing protein [Rhizobiaceae bacterium]
MTGYLVRRILKSASWSRRLASFSLVLFATAVLGHRFEMMETLPFLYVLALAGGLAVLALLLALFAFVRLWRHGDHGGANIVAGVLVASLVLIPYAVSAYHFVIYPQATDISTDMDDPPQLMVAAGARTPQMNPIGPFTPGRKEMLAGRYPLVTGRRYEMPFSLTVQAAEKVLEGRAWRVVRPASAAIQPGEATIEAVARTTFLALPVDVSLRLTDEGATTYVDMRSASRFGPHDLGDNAARIASFLEELDAAVAAMAGQVPAEPADGEGAGVAPEGPPTQ